MNRIKLWQAIVLVVLAVGVAAVVIRRSTPAGEKGAPIPAPLSGPVRMPVPGGR